MRLCFIAFYNTPQLVLGNLVCRFILMRLQILYLAVIHIKLIQVIKLVFKIFTFICIAYVKHKAVTTILIGHNAQLVAGVEWVSYQHVANSLSHQVATVGCPSKALNTQLLQNCVYSLTLAMDKRHLLNPENVNVKMSSMEYLMWNMFYM